MITGRKGCLLAVLYGFMDDVRMYRLSKANGEARVKAGSLGLPRGSVPHQERLSRHILSGLATQ